MRKSNLLYGLVVAGLAQLLTRSPVAAVSPVHLELSWSAPIVGATMPTKLGPVRDVAQGNGVVLRAAYAMAGGEQAYLADVISPSATRVALLPAGASSTPVILSFGSDASRGRSPLLSFFRRPPRDPAILTAAAGAGGHTWVGGFANAYMDLGSRDHSSAFLARVDPAGHSVLETLLGPGMVINLLARPNGDLVTLLRESEVDSRVVTIDRTGRVLSTSRLRGVNAAAMAPSGSGLVVAGLARTPLGPGYHEDVVFWMVSATGVLSGPHLLRPALNTTAGAYYGQVNVFPANDGVYVTSAWSGFPSPKALEVAFITGNGHVAWSRTLADTLASRPYLGIACSPTLIQLGQTSALGACAHEGEIRLYRFAHGAGDYTEDRLPLPECQGKPAAVLFLSRSPGGDIRLSGSRIAGNVGSSCSWTGRLVGLHPDS